MGSSQSAPVQQVVNTIEQFGYHPATVFKFFTVIGIIAGVSIVSLPIWRHKKALDVSAPLRAAKVLRKATQQTHISNMPGQDRHLHLQQRCRHPHHCHLLPSTKTLEQWVFFLVIILPLYTTVIWYLLSRPTRTSLFQFTMATMVWSANPIPSLIQLHSENMATSYADGRMLTSQPILPAAAASTLQHPRHLLTMFGLSSESDLSKTSSGYANMCAFQFQEDLPPSPSSLLPAGANTEASPDTIDSSLVIVINKEDFPNSNIDSLDDVSSLPYDVSEFLSDTSSTIVLPDPSPFLTQTI